MRQPVYLNSYGVDDYEPVQDYPVKDYPMQDYQAWQDEYHPSLLVPSQCLVATQPNFFQGDYYCSDYAPQIYSPEIYAAQMGYYPAPFNFYPVEDEYEEDEYEDEYEEETYLDEYGTVEYRLEVFGGDAFIEFSYEGDLDEQQVIDALNLMWASSPNRQNHVASGTLRLPLSSHSYNPSTYYLP